MSPRRFGLATQVAVAVVFVLGVFAARVVTAGKAELHTAMQLERTGDLDFAIVHYRRAARWYLPFSPVVSQALDHLANLGEGATRAKDPERALSAWRAVRAAILSTRSFYTPNAERLRTANGKIADILSTHDVPPMDKGKTPATLRAEHLALLTAERRPHVLWALLALLGFATWVFGAFAFFRRALDEDDRLIPAAAWRFATVIVVGLGLFVLGLALA